MGSPVGPRLAGQPLERKLPPLLPVLQSQVRWAWAILGRLQRAKPVWTMPRLQSPTVMKLAQTWARAYLNKRQQQTQLLPVAALLRVPLF